MAIPDDLIGVKEAARLMVCSTHTVRRWMRTGRIKGYLRGRSRYLVSRSEILAQILEVNRLPAAENQAAVDREHEKAMEMLRKRGMRV